LKNTKGIVVVEVDVVVLVGVSAGAVVVCDAKVSEIEALVAVLTLIEPVIASFVDC
jgi:hypothetical protein